ncbi:hypothetical protein D3C72_1231670 [compost metagenome]
MDRMRQQLLAGAGLAQQQHRAGGLRGAARVALHLHGRRAAADEAREGVFGTALAVGRVLVQRVVALAGQLAARVVEVALQQRELADERLQRGLGLVEQHDADGADDLAQALPVFALLAQRDAADHEGAGLVGQQVDEDRLAGFEHAAHHGVGNHVLDHVAHELVDGRETQRRQEAAVALVHPDDAPAAVDQEHALADARKQMKHRARGERQDAFGVQGQGGWRCGGGGSDGHARIVLCAAPAPAARRPTCNQKQKPSASLK